MIAAVLILLNSYPLLVSQNLMVSSTQANLRSTAKVIESALMGLEQLTEENVSAALSGLNEAGATRIMVTDSAGLVVYASGYAPQKDFWLVGTAMVFVALAIFFGIGLPYWKLLGLW